MHTLDLVVGMSSLVLFGETVLVITDRDSLCVSIFVGVVTVVTVTFLTVLGFSTLVAVISFLETVISSEDIMSPVMEIEH